VRVAVTTIAGTGHALPALALARELRSRGHEVTLYAPPRWRETATAIGLSFEPGESAPRMLATRGEQGVAEELAAAARADAEDLTRIGPDAVVRDAMSTAPALAAELAGIPQAKLLAHPYPGIEPGYPTFMVGMVPPRTPVGRFAWRGVVPVIRPAMRRARARLDHARSLLGLGPLDGFDWGRASTGPTLVATFPQLEHPRAWPADVHVTGPMIFDPPHEGTELDDDGRPLVVVGSSTALEPDALVDATMRALEGEPVRVLATLGSAGATWPRPLTSNAVVSDWVDYADVMPRAALVVCPGGHGTVARALAEGTPVLVSPATGEQATNGARVAWAGVGRMVPRRLLGARSLRWAIRELLDDPSAAERAQELARWSRAHDGAVAGADVVESLAP
jgi:UDP:flavonoid glycosyltransferase YjiC (YdhE family)